MVDVERGGGGGAEVDAARTRLLLAAVRIGGGADPELLVRCSAHPELGWLFGAPPAHSMLAADGWRRPGGIGPWLPPLLDEPPDIGPDDVSRALGDAALEPGGDPAGAGVAESPDAWKYAWFDAEGAWAVRHRARLGVVAEVFGIERLEEG